MHEDPSQRSSVAGETSAARLISLLDHAYEAAEASHAYDDLFVDADAYFFPFSAKDGPAADLPSEDEISPILTRHLDRIQAVINRAEIAEASHLENHTGPRLASLVISADSGAVLGNKVSEGLMGCKFPVALADLPIAPTSLRKIDDLLTALNAGQFDAPRTLVVQVKNHPVSLVTKCAMLQSVGLDGSLRRALSMTLSHVDWDVETLDFARESFDLSLAEVQLLQNFLQGASQVEAAKILGKSRETIKAQAKAILRKSGQQQMSDVLNLVTSYAFLASTDRSANTAQAPRHRAEAGTHLLKLKSGRSVEVHRYGKRGGAPVMMFHGLYQGPYFSERMSDDFYAAGLDVIAPSRPGFNRTDAPDDWTTYCEQTTSDVVDLSEMLDLGPMTFLVHQAGISFACRAAGALGAHVRGAVMVGAGVPIEDRMMSKMNRETRVAAAGSRYAPTLLDMLLRVGIAKWRRAGARAYLENYFGTSSPEMKTLQDPELGPLMEQGIYHMISQGSRTIIEDGKSAMSDWTSLYPMLDCPQIWMHGTEDPVMNYQFVEEFLATQSKSPPILFEDVGGDILYAQFDQVLEQILSLSQSTDMQRAIRL